MQQDTKQLHRDQMLHTNVGLLQLYDRESHQKMYLAGYNMMHQYMDMHPPFQGWAVKIQKINILFKKKKLKRKKVQFIQN